jgi:threonyl-tRNA synthetase
VDRVCLYTLKSCIERKIRTILEKAQKKAGYEQVITPHIGQKELCYLWPLCKYGEIA